MKLQSIVRASPSGKEILCGRGRKMPWMHLECNEQCIEFLNGTKSYTSPTTVEEEVSLTLPYTAFAYNDQSRETSIRLEEGLDARMISSISMGYSVYLRNTWCRYTRKTGQNSC